MYQIPSWLCRNHSLVMLGWPQMFLFLAECKVEIVQSMEVPPFTMKLCMEKKKKMKLEGQPSKNLMVERRQRKRLNDRLSMLRSVVSKINKMDRTSILGDTTGYMKELKESISNLQEEIDVNSSELNLNGGSIFKDLKQNELLFDIVRRNADTRIEICCTSKPGLLVSTMTTLEALGLEIQQCVISCFNDFSLKASCSEDSLLKCFN